METEVRHDALPVGAKLHVYVIESVLGSGAFGITYRVRHSHFDSQHVIKEYFPESGVRDRGTQRITVRSQSEKEVFTWGLDSFFKEAKLLHGLSHPNIVKVSDLFESNDTAYFVMPWIEGKTLHDWMKETPKPDQETLESIFIPLLEGLKYIHEKGLLHRDIKPENILLPANGMPVLIDFGAARQAIGMKSRVLTQVLTPHFAPIEQYGKKGNFTASLDLYSFSVCLYQCITGVLPDVATDRILEDSLVPLGGSAYESDYTSAFLSGIDKGLALRAEERHPDGFSMQKALLGKEGKEGPSGLSAAPKKPVKEDTETFVPLGGSGDAAVQEKDNIPVTTKEQPPLSLKARVLSFLPRAKRRHDAERYGVHSQLNKITNSVGMSFVKIPAGEFWMGSPENEPERDNNEKRHRVRISKAFYMMTTQVTQGQWERVMGSNPSHFKDCGKDCPVESVSWNEVQEFIKKLNVLDKSLTVRLPTEAEWEYACRAGTETPFVFGTCLSISDANYNGNYPLPGCPKGNYRGKPIKVASFKPNAWGLYDMHGNVWEWVQDVYKKEYETLPGTDPIYAGVGDYRVNRGGGWFNSARNCRSASRVRSGAVNRGSRLGFRLAGQKVLSGMVVTAPPETELDNIDGLAKSLKPHLVRKS